MSRPPGSPKTPGSGRKRGSLNKVTPAIRAIARGFVDDPEYRAALRKRLLDGTAGTLELRLWEYAYGRPAVVSEDGQAPTSITIHF